MLQSKLSRIPQRLPMPAPQAGQVLAQHFPFPTGVKTKDYSGYGNDGTITGAAYTNAPDGSALQFDGINNMINCGSDSSIDISTGGTFSFSILFTLDLVQTWLSLLGKGYSIGVEEILLLTNGLKQIGIGIKKATVQQISISGDVLVANRTYRVVVTVDEVAQECILYLDSVEQSRDTAFSLPDMSAYDFTILGALGFNKCVISEVLVSNEVMTPMFIKDLQYDRHYICRGA